MFKFFILFLVAQQIQAAEFTFECQTFINLDVVASDIVETKIGKKKSANKTDIAESFLTQKSEHEFSLEAYFPQHQMRLYAEADLAAPESSKLSLTMWSRDALVDIVCRKLTK